VVGGKQNVMQGVSLTISPGHSHCIFGSSRSGDYFGRFSAYSQLIDVCFSQRYYPESMSKRNS
jgi:ABC-type histidine transport system ATPase subunit